MEEEKPQLLALFDFFWFRQDVLLDSPLPAVPLPALEKAHAASDAAPDASSAGAPQMPHLQKSSLRRTLSDEVTLATSSDSVLLVRRPLKLQTISSGKDVYDEKIEDQKITDESHDRVEKLEARVDEINAPHKERERIHKERRRAARGTSLDGQSKSLSELEFEELKGFMDLGFTFSETAETDQRLLSIVPGLRRWASSEKGVVKETEEGEGGAEEPAIVRPYLSEAWNVVADYHESKRSNAHNHLLQNWRVPVAGEGIDMKDHLRSWAHTVASIVQ